MSTISGLPAHIFWVHSVVVLVPLTAILLIICSLWKTAREKLVWFTSILSVVVFLCIGFTIKAGQWLARDGMASSTLAAHENAGEHAWIISIALLLATGFLIYIHKTHDDADMINPALYWILVSAIVIISLWSLYAIRMIGELGAQSVWGGNMMM